MRSRSPKPIYTLLAALLLVSFFLGTGIGAVRIPPGAVAGILCKAAGLPVDATYDAGMEAVLLSIRLPRVCLAALIGAALATAGASMQGLFRNPLADPGLIGISSGASLFAVMYIVTGLRWFPALAQAGGASLLSLVTFAGAFIATISVYRLSRSGGRTVVGMMLLSGIAINALASAFTGLFTYSANDVQLRSIVFWTLGSLGGATWSQVLGILPFTLLPVLLLPRMAKSLNALALGESDAAHLGVAVERVKSLVVLLTALCVGASVAVSGVIGFAGLVVPHIVRLLVGPDHRSLLPLSALAGAVLLLNADLISRTVFSPAEVPIGIITALIGAPYFLYLLLRERKLIYAF